MTSSSASHNDPATAEKSPPPPLPAAAVQKLPDAQLYTDRPERDADSSEPEQGPPASEFSGFFTSQRPQVTEQHDQTDRVQRYRLFSTVDLNRIEDLFVDPDRLNSFIELHSIAGDFVPDRRIVAVCGTPGSGRSSIALRLATVALKHQTNPGIFLYDPQLPSLDELLSHADTFDRNSAFIVENFLRPGSSWDFCSDEHFGILHQNLVALDSYLFLVCPDLSETPLANLRNMLVLSLEKNVSADFINHVIDKHFRYYRNANDDAASGDAFWEQIAEPIRMLGPELARIFRVAPQVAVFFHRLSRDRLPGARAEDVGRSLLDLAKTVTETDRGIVRGWFRSMPTHAQLYAMLVQLFEGLNGNSVHELFRLICGHLSAEIPDLRAERRMGIEELHEQVRCVTRVNEQVTFELSAYADEVERQIESFRHLLWDAILATVVPWIKSHLSHADWVLRKKLGNAIGRLSVYEWEQCRSLLTDLASHPNGSVASVCGYIVQSLITQGGPGRQPDRLCEINTLLREWADSGDANRKWTVAATVWRCYEPLVTLAETKVDSNPDLRQRLLDVVHDTEQILELLASGFTGENQSEIRPEDWDVLHSIVRAVLEMFRVRPARTVSLVIRWLQVEDLPYLSGTERISDESGEDEPHNAADEKDQDASPQTEILQRFLVRYTGFLSAEALLTAGQEQRFLSERIHGELLKLATPLLSSGLISQQDEISGSHCQQILIGGVAKLLTTVRAWLSGPGSEAQLTAAWESRILGTLIRALNRSAQIQRQALVGELCSNWLVNSSETLRGMARSLLVRAAIVEGKAIDLPGQQFGVLVLDGSASVAEMSIISEIADSLTEQLRIQSDLYTGRLGQLAWTSTPKTPASETGSRGIRNQPRLIMPILDRLEARNVHYVVILAAGPVSDLEDALIDRAAIWPDRITGAQLGRALPGQDGSLLGLLIQIRNRAVQQESLTRILFQTEHLLEYSLAQRSTEQWSEALRRFLPDNFELSTDAIADLLRTLCDSMDEVPPVDANCEIATLASAALQWLAAHDAGKAVSVLLQWAAGEPETARVPLALSYAQMLLRIMFQHPGWQDFLPGSDKSQTVTPKMRHSSQTKSPASSVVASDTLTHLPALPAPSSKSAFLQFGPMLARHGHWRGVRDYFRWIRRWLWAPDWAKRICGGEEVLTTIDDSPPHWRSRLQVLINDLGNSKRAWGDSLQQSPPEAALRLCQMLKIRLSLGRRKSIDWRAVGGRCLVLLFDPTDDTMVEIVKILWNSFSNKSKFPDLSTVAYRLGIRDPAVLPGERPSPEMLSPDNYPGYNLLAGPILESLPVTTVSCVVLLTKNRPPDLDDMASDWIWHGHFYYEGEKPDWAPQWESTSVDHGFRIKDAAACLHRNLKAFLEAKL